MTSKKPAITDLLSSLHLCPKRNLKEDILELISKQKELNAVDEHFLSSSFGSLHLSPPLLPGLTSGLPSGLPSLPGLPIPLPPAAFDQTQAAKSGSYTEEAVNLVMGQAGVSKERARKALEDNNGDITAALLSITY